MQLYVKIKTTQRKNGQKITIDVSSKKAERWPKVHEKMLNITNYQRNANQNCKEVSPHTMENGHHPKVTNNKYWKPSHTVGGNVNWYNHNREQYGGSLKN